MKSKFVQSLFLIVGLGSIYLTTSSSSNGYTSNNGTSCGNCHGNQNTATTVAFSGIPTSYITGQTYPVTFTITNATNTKYGFNVFVSAGTLVAGTGSKLSGGQLTHSSPSSSNSFTFNWIAPSTVTSVTFKGVGNAVNGNGNNDSGDQWNNTSTTITGNYPASIGTIDATVLKCYPNPATDKIIIEGLTQEAKDVQLFNINGQAIVPSYTNDANNCIIQTSNLATGTYFVHATINGKNVKAAFVKN